MKIDKQKLLDLDLPWDCFNEEIDDTSRWSLHCTGLFKMNGKIYQVAYDKPATEQQTVDPWYDDEVEITEVELKEVMVMKWVPVRGKK